MAFRYMEDFNRDEMLKYAKGELALENKPVTEENIEKKMDDLYYEWLLSKVVDVIDKNDGIYNLSFLLNTLKRIPIKYCIIVEQWVESKPIHYEGEHFTFEEIYNNAKGNTDEIGIVYSFYKLVECIHCFKQGEKRFKELSDCKKNIQKIKRGIKGGMESAFFMEINK